MLQRTLILFIAVLFFSCSREKKKVRYSLSDKGYYYQLLTFTDKTKAPCQDYFCHLNVTFSTQNDSVFWDSFNNLNDEYFMPADSGSANFLEHYLSGAEVGDSSCLLVRTPDFFSQFYSSPDIPFFSSNDSVVKINVGIKDRLSVSAMEEAGKDQETEEFRKIEAFFPTVREYELSADAAGFFWLERPGDPGTGEIKDGDRIYVSYRGQFLNGRFLDASAQRFEYRYGTPDQLLRGLNIVIGKLKVGQNAKIILPSRLAFGEYGSTNGSVPPYTPLIYEVAVQR